MAIGTDTKIGAVYVFIHLKNAWKEVAKIDSYAGSEKFGKIVSLSGMNIFVSSLNNAYHYTLIEDHNEGICMSFTESE